MTRREAEVAFWRAEADVCRMCAVVWENEPHMADGYRRKAAAADAVADAIEGVGDVD